MLREETMSLKLAILSRSPGCYSTKRLKSAAEQRGHKVKVLNTTKFSISVEETTPSLAYRGKRLANYDAVIPRIGASITFFGTAVVRQFEQMGVFTLSSSNAISVSRDKLRALQVLSRHEIGIPTSAFTTDKDDILPSIERVGGAPVIIKILEGTQGVGVILADTSKMAEAIIQTLHGANQNVLVQKFVKESKGRDVRAFVVGDRVVAAMRRKAQGDEFRSNVHRGGTTESVELDEHYQTTAVRAAHIMGLPVAGVDMLESKDGPQVLEVNSSPGLEGIESVTGVDVAGAIVKYLEEQVYFPEVDIRQRLSLGKGYNIVEIPVSAKSDLVNKALKDTNLRELEIHVLSINRQKLIFPNPRGTDVILDGDVLLCYGKGLTLKSLVPPKKKRSERKKKKLSFTPEKHEEALSQEKPELREDIDPDRPI